MRTVIILSQAQLDLLEIWDHIAKDNLIVANRVSGEIDRAILGLGEMPGKGHFRPDVNDPAFRCWSVYSYIIVYRYDDVSLTVVRVVHGARDFRKLFPG